MSKENIKGVTIVGSLLGIAGFVMIFFSVNFGTNNASSWLARQGGADTAYYNIIVKSYINIYLTTGGILFVIGSLVVILSYYQLQIKGLKK